MNSPCITDSAVRRSSAGGIAVTALWDARRPGSEPDSIYRHIRDATSPVSWIVYAALQDASRSVLD